MCTNKLKIDVKDGKHVIGERLVECRNACDECIKKQHRWWTGRLNAEATTSCDVWFLTLTYNDLAKSAHSKVLVYRDIQLLMKRIRKAKHKVKMLTVGEYGEKRGRAHWHMLLFWETPPPAVEFDNPKYHWQFWHDHETDYPLGFVEIEKPRSLQGSLSYLLKYMNKDLTKEGRDKGKLQLNKMVKYSQGFGKKYLQQWARQKARDGLPLYKTDNRGNVQDRYTIPGNVNPKNNQLFWYHVGRDNCLEQPVLQAYLEEWATLRPDQLLPRCDDVRDYLEELHQNPISHPQLAVYAERHYGYQKGVYCPFPANEDELNGYIHKWVSLRENLKVLPNQVQIKIYQELSGMLRSSGKGVSRYKIGPKNFGKGLNNGEKTLKPPDNIDHSYRPPISEQWNLIPPNEGD